MPRYIDADALKHELCIRQHMLNADSLWKTLEIMDAQPTADVVERKRGKWIAQRGGGYRCSECKHYALDERDGNLIHVSAKTKFCPHCGADMREEKTDE